MKVFEIKQNKYLNRDVLGVYHCDYLGYQKKDNPDYINHLKNAKKKSEMDLVKDFIAAYEAIKPDLQELVKKIKNPKLMVCCVPRSKADSSYANSQLLFRKVVSCVADELDLTDGTMAIKRIKDTKVTHNWRLEDNNGNAPYVGITRDTCRFDTKQIRGKDIILVDDIYTKGINIDEDCIQALFDLGAKNVILYIVAKAA
ncbi:MAG: amidophosphoribosyltransferase [Firmicutes bacterium]|nr:amidophosphoribosyltransferase [Bacillota bacterium]